ncbi:MAG: hypothetical protein II855_01960 [Candidatus Methanomethylophilaceae archaeon]|nr:hypothetical protein [Candidatus Methanomethylophilaceae archaeon]
MKDAEILNILSRYSDKAKIGLAMPAVTLDTIIKNREFCATDDCGCYGKYCSCPPLCGTPEERLDVLAHYSKSAIVPILFHADYRNREQMKNCTKTLQDKCREMVLELRKAGLECLGFADDGCRYCERCAALDGKPCRFPDMQIQSVSGNGIQMMDYLKASGLENVFEEGRIEMYAVIVYN